MAAVTSESMCPARKCTVKMKGDGGNANGTGACRQCLLSSSCNFNQAVSLTGLAALRRQLLLSFTIIIQVLFPFSPVLLRQGQPWLIWAICSADYERCGSPAHHMPPCSSPNTHSHVHGDTSTNPHHFQLYFKPSPPWQQYEGTV